MSLDELERRVSNALERMDLLDAKIEELKRMNEELARLIDPSIPADPLSGAEYDTPETVAVKMKQARSIRDRFNEIMGGR